jgi:hypothetical protein
MNWRNNYLNFKAYIKVLDKIDQFSQTGEHGPESQGGADHDRGHKADPSEEG